MPVPFRSRSGTRRPTTVLGTAAVAGVLLFASSSAAVAAPASWPFPDRGSDYVCDPGLYRIHAATNPWSLTVAQSSWNHGSVIQYAWNNESNQKWQICRKPTGGTGELVVFRDAWRHWCVAVDRAMRTDGAWINTVGCDDDYVPDNQKFRMERIGNNNLFAIQAQHSGKWLAAEGHRNNDNGVQTVQDSRADLYSLQAV